jgi:hypothetical protein
MGVNEMRLSPAERVDRMVDAALATGAPHRSAPADLRPLATLASTLRDTLTAVPLSEGFDSHLAARLADAADGRRAIGMLRHRGRLLVTGAAVSSAAVGVTAFAVWRSTRRQSAHRFWER